MELSNEQKEILNFSLTDDWDILIINGPAGSGKTTLQILYIKNLKRINQIISYILLLLRAELLLY